MRCRDKLIVALDSSDYDKIFSIVDAIGEDTYCFKVGMQCFYRFGEKIIADIKKRGHKVFLDLKIHDIPNTAAEALKSLSHLDIDFLTYHLSGSETMLKAIKQAQTAYSPSLRLIGVSYLTSLSEVSINQIYGSNKIQSMFKLAARFNTDIVCAANDITQRYSSSSYFCPGIRLNLDQSHDQKRIITPLQAIHKGADYLIMGRSITNSNNPKSIITQINQELSK